MSGELDTHGFLQQKDNMSGEVDTRGFLQQKDNMSGELDTHGFLMQKDNMSGELDTHGFLPLKDDVSGGLDAHGFLPDPDQKGKMSTKNCKKKLLSEPKREIDKFFIAEGSSSFRMKISKKKQKINSKILLLFKKSVVLKEMFMTRIHLFSERIQDPGPGFASASELNGS